MQSPSLRSTLHELCYRLQKQAMVTVGKSTAPHFGLILTQAPLVQAAQSKNGLRDKTRENLQKGCNMYELKTETAFDSAHFLTDYYGKCENLHGHRWRVVVYLRQEKLQTEGTMKDMVLDFTAFKRIVRAQAEAMDHMFLVEEGSLAPATVAALEGEGFSLLMLPFRTTSENLARYFAEKLIEQGLDISRVGMYETPNNCAIWYSD